MNEFYAESWVSATTQGFVIDGLHSSLHHLNLHWRGSVRDVRQLPIAERQANGRGWHDHSQQAVAVSRQAGEAQPPPQWEDQTRFILISVNRL